MLQKLELQFTPAMGRLDIHPNPCIDQVTIRTGLAQGECSVLDMNGRTMARQEITALEFTLSTAGLAPGPYVVRIMNANGLSSKLITKIPEQ